MGRTAGANPGRIQGIPLAAGPQHEEDGIHGAAVVDPRVMAPPRMRFARRQQGLNPLPKRIRDPPTIVFVGVWHSPSLSLTRFATFLPADWSFKLLLG